jgi:C4-dicarboxylate transporter, DctQ subunit
MWESIGRLYHGLIKGLAAFAALLIVFSVGLIVYDVGSRTLGFGSVRSTIAISEYILLYFTLFSAPYLLNTRGHVMVDMVIKNLFGLPKRILESVVYLIGIAVSLTFLIISVEIIRNAIARGHFDERSIDLPYWLLYAGFPLTFGLMTIEFLRYLLTSRSMYDHDEVNEGL